MKRWPAKFIALAAVAALSVFCAGAWGIRENSHRSGRDRKFSAEFFGTFDTVVTFTAFAPDEAEFERFLGVVRGEMERMSRLFDIYNSYEGVVNVKTTNEAAGTTPLKVDREILDPKTLYPAENVKSVTVIHPDSATADMLSTAAFIMTPEDARALLTKHGAEAIWMTDGGAGVATPGYLEFSKQAKSPGRGGLRVIGQ